MDIAKRKLLRNSLIGGFGTVSVGAIVDASAQTSPKLNPAVPLIITMPDKSVVALEKAGGTYKAFNVPTNPSGQPTFMDGSKPIAAQLADYQKSKKPFPGTELTMPGGTKVPMANGVIKDPKFNPQAMGIAWKETAFGEIK